MSRQAHASIRLNALFLFTCLIWGVTWVPIKIGVAAVPPLFFAGLRFIAAGAVLLAVAKLMGLEWRVDRGHVGSILTTALLTCSATYALLFWGVRHIPSGLAAAESMGLIPIALLLIASFRGEEEWSVRGAAAILLGVTGLLLLFRADLLGVQVESLRTAGVLAVGASSFVYALGAVISRPLLRTYSALTVSGWSFVLGSAALLAMALLIEPIDRSTMLSMTEPAVALSWLFLVFFGSVIAFSAFMRLVRDWSPSRAGMYAFVSPVIAVVVGNRSLGETVGGLDILAMVAMLAGAWLAMDPLRPSPHAEELDEPSSM